jgi:hypothetical protein
MRWTQPHYSNVLNIRVLVFRNRCSHPSDRGGGTAQSDATCPRGARIVVSRGTDMAAAGGISTVRDASAGHRHGNEKPALLTVLAVPVVPALAGDQDTAIELRDTGRYVPQAGLPEWNGRNVPANAFAAVGRPVRVPVSRPMFQSVAPAYDFQLDSR